MEVRDTHEHIDWLLNVQVYVRTDSASLKEKCPPETIIVSDYFVTNSIRFKIGDILVYLTTYQ